MRSRLCSWLLFSVMGWRENITVALPDKFVLCLAPHTSNWDFIIGQLYMRAGGLRVNFMMKREWFRGPLDRLFRRLGGIPVRRDKSSSLTDSLAAEAARSEHFRLCITPEGTRSRNPHWKRGFYYIALKAQLPIVLFAMDYDRRLIECTTMIHPTGDVDADMLRIKRHYKDYRGRHPERFSIGGAGQE